MSKGQERLAYFERTVVPFGCGSQLEVRLKGFLLPCSVILCSVPYLCIASPFHQRSLHESIKYHLLV